MMMVSDTLSKRNLTILFIISIIAQVFVITLFILLSAFNYIGFDGNSPISASCPSNDYYQRKYLTVGIMIETAYIFCILSLVSFSAVLVIMIKNMVSAKDTGDSQFYVSKCVKISLYVLTSLAIMTAIPPFGHYVSTMAEINGCTASYDSSKLAAVIAIATTLIAFLLVFFVLLFIFFCAATDEKYREVQSHPTEPHEKVQRAEQVKYFNKKHLEKEEPYKKQPQVYEKRTPQQMEKNSPPKRVANRGEELEHTKQYLFNSPSRAPVINTYRKEPDPRPLLKESPQKKYESKEPAPLLQPKPYNKQVQSPSKYTSPSRAPRENQGELMYHKPRTRQINNDDEDFSRQQSKYLSKYGDRPILSRGVEEVNSREKRANPDYFRAGELPRRYENSSPSKVGGGREGNLINYIRGKYHN